MAALGKAEGTLPSTPYAHIERAEIDGVPLFWTSIDGPRTAALTFRVGRADNETLAAS
jgi:hypothetical protein